MNHNHHDLLTLTGRDGATLHLLAAATSDENVSAEGYITDTYLRRGRVFTSPDGSRYRLARGLPAGVTWEEPVQLSRS